ncbi:response regulator transcription factor [Gordonibacter massiliensis (ex Traore et al. 2017)]|uniref:response regulator transcription factor n=1 Tax=Gordonibacter massiliensis (ex Traore et al. 2017) TaxID=1841863 RepID=UPI001C8BA9C9|nr:response regulator transcription factor [Gordonibacter massiliensis (ex Traore et al. 2017)]MBX9032772.1 response regulator transcription factor [Gordonibacter massiliensis (ex Traore et al. 2017)]
MARILLADDEESMKNVVEHIVVQGGHEFLYAKNGADALALFADRAPDLVILDVMMPDVNGFDACDAIRRRDQDVPVMFLSAKGDIVDKSMGFKMGCDDYLVKPFSPAELALRIEALLRRRDHARPDAAAKRSTIEAGDLVLDLGSYEAVKAGRPLDLTAKEFEILSFMAQHPGQVFTRDQLFENVWGEDVVSDANTITVFIRKIREKVEDDPSKPRYVLTVWGVGYKFAAFSIAHQGR